MVDPISLGPTSLGNPWGTDWEFYSCNIFHWLDILSGFGLDNLRPPDQQALVSFCDGYFERKGFTSGPLFPFLAYFAFKIGSIVPLRIITFLCFFYYLFVSYVIVFREFGSFVARVTVLVLFASPILWWLAWSPSTDLIAVCLYLHGMAFFLLPYVKRRHAQLVSMIEVTLRDSLVFYIRFSLVTLLALLFRPAFFQFGILILILLSLELSIVNKRASVPIISWESVKRLAPSLCASAMIVFCYFLKVKIYASYGTSYSPFYTLFYSFSPPAPDYLFAETQSIINFWTSEFRLSMLFTGFNDLAQKFVVSVTLVVNNLIYGLLSLSGISSKFGYQPGYYIFRVIAMTGKALYGCLIVFPSIMLMFAYAVSAIRGLLSGLRNCGFTVSRVGRYLGWQHAEPGLVGKNVLFTCGITLVIFHLLTIQANRYLIPVLPFLIAMPLDWARSKKVFVD